MRPTAPALALVVTALSVAARIQISRKALFQEIIRQLTPPGRPKGGPRFGPSFYALDGAPGGPRFGPRFYAFDDALADDSGPPSCPAEILLAEDRRASCRARKQLVPLPPGPPDVLRFPRLVELERCHGACQYDALLCRPTRTEPVVVQVVSVNVSSGKPVAQCAEVEMEKHVKCRCGCRVQRSHCSEHQVYVASECACRCPGPKLTHQCNGLNHVWDPLRCRCACIDGEQTCSSGYHFSSELCRCVPDEENNF